MKIQKLSSELKNNGLDVILLTSKINRRYITGFESSDGTVLVFASGKAYYLVDFRYIESARKNTAEGIEVVMTSSNVSELIKGYFNENSATKIGFEDSELSYAMYQKYLKDFEITEMQPSSAIMRKLREVKSPEEIETIKKAQAITDAAFSHVLDIIHPSMTEIDLALEIEFFMRKNGASGIAFDTIAVSGAASSLPHGSPRNVKLEAGFLTMDFGAKYQGYCSDMTRTVVIGKADDEMKTLYNTVLSAQLAALEALAVGKNCAEMDAVARDIIYGAGYTGCFGHSLGHGLGLYVHETPSLSSFAKERTLEVGNIVTCEPGIYIEGKYGCRIEDMALITGDENRIYNFTKSTKELIELF